MKTITESYFGQELIPLDIVVYDGEKIYICKTVGNEVPMYYDKNGLSAMELSSIDIKEFEEIYYAKD